MADDIFDNPDNLPQPIGDYRPLDEWQAHINAIFYGLRGARVHEFYQTFASADYRLAHALAADYYEQVTKRDEAKVKAKGVQASQSQPQPQPQPVLTILELGPGNGNLAACFLSHLKRLDTDGRIYPRVRYLMVDRRKSALEAAAAHPGLMEHRGRVEMLVASADTLAGIGDGTVDRIICNELWNELPTKLMLRNGSEIEEEFVRPNLNEKQHAAIADWAGFIKAFDNKDQQALTDFPFALEHIVWEREYRKVEGKAVPYRKTITDFLKQIDDKVLVPVNLGALATLKEAKRVLAPESIGLSGFDAGTNDLAVLNDPEKPCYGQHGGQFSFMINYALMEAAAKQIGFVCTTVESQREFVGRSLAVNVLSLMDVLAMHPSAQSLEPWQLDKLVLQTIHAFNEGYRSPYKRTLDFPLGAHIPIDERRHLTDLLSTFPPEGVPDTVAYLTESELLPTLPRLEALGYDPYLLKGALTAPTNPIEYCHFFCRPS